MASTSNAESDSPALGPVDAAADLELLDRAKSRVDIDQFLDFGPWWYAPLLATVLGGFSLFGQDFSNLWNILFAVAGLAAGCAVSIHDFRRRAVRLRPTRRSAAFVVFIVVISWMMVAAWGTAISSLGYERFVPGYAALAWGLTSAAFLGIRAALMAIRRQRAPLS